MPLEINVVRIDQTENSTISKLFIDSHFICFIIEDGERANKIHGMTRIPAGRYKLIKRTFGRFFDKYKVRFGHEFVWEIENVPNFTDILIHLGNRIDDTKGCLLPNQQVAFDGSNYFGVSSKPAYLTLFDKLKVAATANIDIIR